MREITTEVLEPHSFILAPSSNNRPLIASPFLRREKESEHEAERERKRKNTVREMAGGHGSSSVTITFLQRDLLIQRKIDTWIWFHPVDPYKALMVLRALLPSLVAYLPMNFDSKPSYKSMSAFQWRESGDPKKSWNKKTVLQEGDKKNSSGSSRAARVFPSKHCLVIVHCVPIELTASTLVTSEHTLNFNDSFKLEKEWHLAFSSLKLSLKLSVK